MSYIIAYLYQRDLLILKLLILKFKYNNNTIFYRYNYSSTKDFAKQRYNTPYACNVI